MTKAADIMAAATKGPWTWQGGPQAGRGYVRGPVHESFLTGPVRNENARAIVTAVNLFPLYEAVREAARTYLWSPDSFDDYDPADVPDDEWAPEALALRVALDALQAAEDAL